MSRARRQQRKRARRWALEVRDTVFGWRDWAQIEARIAARVSEGGT